MGKQRQRVSQKRHLAKTISYRVSSIIILTGLTWLITGKLSAGVAVGLVDLIGMSAFYYVHERVWHNLNYGLIDEPGHTSD